MKKTSLLILINDPQMQRMAASWPIFAGHKGKRSPQFFKNWGKISRVTFEDPEEIGEALLAHEICRPDGTLDPLAEAFLGAVITKHISGRKNNESKKDQRKAELDSD